MYNLWIVGRKRGYAGGSRQFFFLLFEKRVRDVQKIVAWKEVVGKDKEADWEC